MSDTLDSIIGAMKRTRRGTSCEHHRLELALHQLVAKLSSSQYMSVKERAELRNQIVEAIEEHVELRYALSLVDVLAVEVAKLKEKLGASTNPLLPQFLEDTCAAYRLPCMDPDWQAAVSVSADTEETISSSAETDNLVDSVQRLARPWEKMLSSEILEEFSDVVLRPQPGEKPVSITTMLAAKEFVEYAVADGLSEPAVFGTKQGLIDLQWGCHAVTVLGPGAVLPWWKKGTTPDSRTEWESVLREVRRRIALTDSLDTQA